MRHAHVRVARQGTVAGYEQAVHEQEDEINRYLAEINMNTCMVEDLLHVISHFTITAFNFTQHVILRMDTPRSV